MEAVTSTLLEEFVIAAGLYGTENDFTNEGETNRGYDEMVRILQKLDLIAGGRLALRHLLDHPNHWVKKSAAARLLNHAPEVAVPVLTGLSEKLGMLGFDARMTLSEWRKGNLPNL